MRCYVYFNDVDHTAIHSGLGVPVHSSLTSEQASHSKKNKQKIPVSTV